MENKRKNTRSNFTIIIRVAHEIMTKSIHVPAVSDQQNNGRTTTLSKHPDQLLITKSKTSGKRPRTKNGSGNRKRQEKKGKWSGKSLKTKYKRVYRIKNSENFQSVFKHNKKQVYVGVYDTALKAAVAADFKCVEVGLPREKLNFPCNYYKYICGLRATGIVVNGLMDEDRIQEEKALPGSTFVTSGLQAETSLPSPEKNGSSAYLSLFDDLDYEQNNQLLSSTQIEIDDNLNVTDQVSLLQPPVKCISGRFNGGPRNNTGFKGVFPVRTRKNGDILHYYIQLTIKGKTISVQGRYKTAIEAARAFDLHCCALGRSAEYCNFPEDYAEMQENNSDIIEQLSKQLMSRRNKLGNRAKKTSRSSGSSNVSSATTSEEDADEVTYDRNKTENVDASHNARAQEKKLVGEDEVVSYYDAMVSKVDEVSQSKDLDGIPDDVVFDFNPLCSDKEDGNEYIDDIITEIPAVMDGADISIDAHDDSTNSGELESRKVISAILTPAHKLPQNDVSITYDKVSYV